jgi:hypothetical protein
MVETLAIFRVLDIIISRKEVIVWEKPLAEKRSLFNVRFLL